LTAWPAKLRPRTRRKGMLGSGPHPSVTPPKKESMTELAKREATTPYRKYTPEQIIGALEQSKGMISPTARALGCDRNTIKRYLKEYTAVAQAIADEREATTDLAENTLYQAIENGEAWAICFYLKCQGKQRGYIEKAEIGGANGGPVAVKLVYDG
jgi:transposase-like protein